MRLWMRHDIARFFPPGQCPFDPYAPYGLKAKAPAASPASPASRALSTGWANQAETPSGGGLSAEEFEELYREHLLLRRMLAELKLDLLRREFGWKYSPNQPRVPAGSREGGQWTRDRNSAPDGRVRLAGDIPTGDSPDIPKKRPETIQERNKVARRVAKGGFAAELLRRVSPWLEEHFAAIEAYNDPPKSLEELHAGVSDPRPGYDVHHIVEQGPAEKEGFSKEQIEDPNNKVLVPRYKHWDITGWFSTKNEEFGDQSPRDYLRGKSWEERRRVGLEALIRFGVMEP